MMESSPDGLSEAKRERRGAGVPPRTPGACPHMSGRFSSVPLLKGSVLSQQCHGLATKSLTNLLGTLIQTIAITCSTPAVPTFPTDLCHPDQQQCGVHPHKGQLIATIEGSWALVIGSVPHCWNSCLWLRSHAHCSHGQLYPPVFSLHAPSHEVIALPEKFFLALVDE